MAMAGFRHGCLDLRHTTHTLAVLLAASGASCLTATKSG